MSFFPEIEDIKINSSGSNPGRDFVFENGQHIIQEDGTLKECRDVEALKNWIKKVVLTQVDAYEVYVKGETEKFGVNIYDKLGTKNRGYWISELKREITEQITSSRFVSHVRNFAVEMEGRKITVSFTVVTNENIEIKEEVILIA